MKSFFKRHLDFQIIVLIGLSLFTRLLYINTIPRLGSIPLQWRIFSTLAGTVGIICSYLLVKHQFKDRSLAMLTGLVLVFMPWHIEQSRVYSQAIFGLTVLLLTVLLIKKISSNRLWLRLFVTILGALGFSLVYPSFWPFVNQKFISIPYLLENLFKLISFEFIFFKNDSFWSGGLRTYGLLLPFWIPLFLVGLGEVIQKISRAAVPLILFFFVVWLIAALNPMFPEQREYFLISPYLALITALGIQKLFEYYSGSNKTKKAFILIFVIIIIYEYSVFIHFYIKHYTSRISNEIPVENRAF